jgi:hypothetical protein
VWQLPLLFFLVHTFIIINHNHIDIVQYIHPLLFAETSLLHCLFALRDKPPWGAFQLSSALPTEISCTLPDLRTHMGILFTVQLYYINSCARINIHLLRKEKEEKLYPEEKRSFPRTKIALYHNAYAEQRC